mgnify:CR=1 FL=1
MNSLSMDKVNMFYDLIDEACMLLYDEINLDYLNALIRVGNDIVFQIDDSKITLDTYNKLKDIIADLIDKFNDNNFDINQNGYYVLNLDDYHGLLYIFNSKYIPCQNKEQVTYFFDKGVYNVGTITLKSNESIYIDKDAYVFGSIYAENAENLRIYGNGVFDQSYQERLTSSCYVAGNIKLVKCNNVIIDGVGFTNSRAWCISMYNCFGITIDNVKVFGEWKYNTDGIDIVNSQDVTVKNTFVHSFDDTITIKAYDASLQLEEIGNCNYDCKNILIESCTLLCDWGRCLELGFETACKEYKNIVWRDIDILHVEGYALSIHNGDYAEIHDVLFENIRIEFNGFDTASQYQSSDEVQYLNQDVISTPAVLCVNNSRFREEYDLTKEFGEAVKSLKYISYCHHITARNIYLYYDDRIPKVNGKYNARICIDQIVEGTVFDNLVIENLFINGEKNPVRINLTFHDLTIIILNIIY